MTLVLQRIVTMVAIIICRIGCCAVSTCPEALQLSTNHCLDGSLLSLGNEASCSELNSVALHLFHACCTIAHLQLVQVGPEVGMYFLQ